MPRNIDQISRNNSVYPQDTIKIVRPTHIFDGKITQSGIEKRSPYLYDTSVRLVDNAIMVESVDDKTRSVATEYLANYQGQAAVKEKKHQRELWTSVSSLVVGTCVGIGGLIISTPIAVAAAIGGIGMAVLGVWGTVESQRALGATQDDINFLKQKKNEWTDPVQQVIEQRRLAGTAGFHYVFQHQLKGTMIHPEEVRALWLHDFSKLFSHNQGLKTIFDKNLLGSESMEYAWEGRSLPDLEIDGRTFSAEQLNPMIASYRECYSAYQSFNTAINNERSRLTNAELQQRGDIAHQRSRWLQPAQHMRDVSLDEARRLYHQALEPFIQEKNFAIEQARRAYHYIVRDPRNAEEVAYKAQLDSMCHNAIQVIQREFSLYPAVREIEAAYQRDQQMCNFLYSQAKLVVDVFFDQNLRQLDHAVHHAESLIEEQRDRGVQHFSHLLNQILTPDSKNAFQQIDIGNLPVMRNWDLPDFRYEPSWNDVYGRLPNFQPSFVGSVSEVAWNLFWGNNGLGQYASHPTSAWERLFTNKSNFRFNQQWLNLHHYHSTRPLQSLFVRQIHVPPPPSAHVPVGERRTALGFGGTHIR